MDAAEQDASVGRILVVEDEPLVRRTLERRLSMMGHEVVAVDDGAQAIDLLERGESFDLVVTDMLMTPLGGRDLDTWISEHRGDLRDRLVFMTGAGERPDVKAFLESRYWLRKPVQAQEIEGLLVLVRS